MKIFLHSLERNATRHQPQIFGGTNGARRANGKRAQFNGDIVPGSASSLNRKLSGAGNH